jgi:hypothetical protein
VDVRLQAVLARSPHEFTSNCNLMNLKKKFFTVFVFAGCIAVSGAWLVLANSAVAEQEATSAQGHVAITRALGTVQSVSGNTLILKTDAGAELNVSVEANTRLLRVEPGQKDLKSAVPLALSELQPGDRILVRGTLAADGKTVLALAIVAMKHEDILQRQAREQEEWQRGVGGLVKSVDAAHGTIVIATNTLGPAKDLTILITGNTILRRYAPDSIKFDDAKPAPIAEIKPGDQLRARGAKSPDGATLTADEIVSGTFRNIAGIISSIDTAAGTLTVQDLAAKTPVTVRATAETQMRKLPLPFAQRIAMRLKGEPPAPPGERNPGTTAQMRNGTGMRPGANGGGNGGMDLQQILSRMPAATLSDLQKGQAVMIVATQGNAAQEVTAITLLSGVEPILESTSKGGREMLLSPWSLGAAPAEPGSEAGP